MQLRMFFHRGLQIVNYVSKQITEPNQLSATCALSNPLIKDQLANDTEGNKAGIVSIEPLGQSGLLIEWDEYKILIDPYLSNYIQENIDPAMKRSLQHQFYPRIAKILLMFLLHMHIQIMRTRPLSEQFSQTIRMFI